MWVVAAPRLKSQAPLAPAHINQALGICEPTCSLVKAARGGRGSDHLLGVLAFLGVKLAEAWLPSCTVSYQGAGPQPTVRTKASLGPHL